MYMLTWNLYEKKSIHGIAMGKKEGKDGDIAFI